MPTTLYYSSIKTTWGICGFVVSGKTLLRFYLPFPNKTLLKQAVQDDFGDVSYQGGLWPKLQKGVLQYFNGHISSYLTTLLLNTDHQTQFTQDVTNALMRVTVGSTVTYGELADLAGYTGAARGVGSVMRRNVFPLLVPCHRVVPASGKGVGQFSALGGEVLKEKLLAHEASF